jgi:hypothetical protein
MKSTGFAAILALFLLSLTTPPPAAAQTAGSSASGSYRFVLDDELTKSVEFSATTDERGVTTGQMTFIDPTRIPDTDDVEDPRAGDAPPEFYMKATLDGLTVEKNRALMNGTIVDSSHKSYIGKWVQLVVEDNGDNLRVPDQLTWSFCKRSAGGWIPSDAERKDDDGAFLRWWATDAERKDDVGIPSENLISNDEKSCRTYPLFAYLFADLLKWDGNIVVQP